MSDVCNEAGGGMESWLQNSGFYGRIKALPLAKQYN
jgi:hypothetical protein